eukprot:UN02848
MGVKSHDVALKVEQVGPHVKCIFIVRRSVALDFRLKSPDNILNDWQTLFFSKTFKTERQQYSPSKTNRRLYCLPRTLK